MARETYRLGRMCLVRFTLPGDSFLNWSNVPRLYPEWTADQIARTQKAAVENGEAGFNNWRVRMEPLQISQALAVEAKSYTSGRWVPIDATMKSCILLADIENGRGVTIGEYVYLSAKTTVASGQVGYINLGRVTLDEVRAANLNHKRVQYQD
jgi:hypothetical protein